MKAPFWYVVKHKDGGYIGPCGDKHVEHQREARRHLAPLRAAAVAATWWPEGSHRVVRVWGRLPKPRLPQWVDPTPLDAGEVEVWRRWQSIWRRYVFRVVTVHEAALAEALGKEGVWVVYVEVFRPGTAGSVQYTNVDTAPPDVWIEAGLRAAAMIRKANR